VAAAHGMAVQITVTESHIALRAMTAHIQSHVCVSRIIKTKNSGTDNETRTHDCSTAIIY
tara:strand:+ start:77 stop:256 length:180 start_codon:yes stop_codon:yes gene_type:complete